MESEALINIRTMRQVRTSLEIAKSGRSRLATSLSRVRPSPVEPPPDRCSERLLKREQARISSYEASVMRSRRHLLEQRERLAGVIARNRALMDMREQVQRRWQEKSAPDARVQSGEKGAMELQY